MVSMKQRSRLTCTNGVTKVSRVMLYWSDTSLYINSPIKYLEYWTIKRFPNDHVRRRGFPCETTLAHHDDAGVRSQNGRGVEWTSLRCRATEKKVA